MNALSLAEIEQKGLFPLMISFFNLADEDDQYFYIRSTYRRSNFAPNQPPFHLELLEHNNHLLQTFTGLPFRLRSEISGNHEFAIIKKEHCSTRNELFHGLYGAIQRQLPQYSLEERNRLLFLSLFVPRGSADFKGNYYAVDVYRENLSQEYIDYLIPLLFSTGEIKQLNFNFRELQKQYIDNVCQRNAQVRVNLRWFDELFLDDIRQMNIYKYHILQNNRGLILSRDKIETYHDTCVRRMLFYRQRILEQEVDPKQISTLREELEFQDSDDEGTARSHGRNSEIVALVKVTEPDECACCKNLYPIEARTFRLKRNNQWYLEIHHVISFASDRKSDVIDNLVKVCPTCHAALTKNRAPEEYQKLLIEQILINRPKVKTYVSYFLEDSPDQNTSLPHLVDFVYQRLK